MSKYQFVKLSQLTKVKTGKLDANASSEDGKYPFFTCSKEPLKISSFSYDCECVLVAGNGDLNVKYYNGKFDAYQRTYIIESLDKQNLFVPYLYVFLNKYVEKLREQAIGGVIKYIKLENINNAIIPLPKINEQKIIAENMDRVSKLISLRKKQIELLDLLVKSRFVEMFGDPIDNPLNWHKKEFDKGIKEIKYGTSQPPIFVNKGIPFIRATNIKDGRITTNEMLFISDEEASFIEKCKLREGDLIIVRSGANTGDSTFIPKEYEGAFGGYDIIIRLNDDLNWYYVIALLNSRYRDINVNPLTRRAGQPHLNAQQIKSLEICYPPIELQNQFAAFVQQVDKQKFELQNRLNELNILYNSLLQKYFG